MSVCLFSCRECYVYQIPPASSASGHRANDWNVDKWLKEVNLKGKKLTRDARLGSARHGMSACTRERAPARGLPWA